MKRSSDRVYDELLVLHAQDGENEALNELVRRWQPRLIAYAIRVTGHREAARDITQEAWLAMVRSLRKLDDPARFPAWAYRIVKNKCIDWIRSRQRQRAGEEKIEMELKIDAGLDHSGDEIAALRKMIAKLPEESRQVLIMHYTEGFSTAEIGDALGIPRGTVKSRLHHARLALKTMLGTK